MIFLKRAAVLLSLMMLTLICAADTNHTKTNSTDVAMPFPQVKIKTDSGTFFVELYPEKAPLSVQNFLGYVDSGHYKGTIFHRVIAGFMVQGGGLTYDFKKKDVGEPIKNEADNGLLNTQFTLAMARTGDPDSATAQFFVNLVDNPHLDKSAQSAGYTVFGKVINGQEVIQKIEREPQGLYRAYPNAPNYAVRILEIDRVTPKQNAQNAQK